MWRSHTIDDRSLFPSAMLCAAVTIATLFASNGRPSRPAGGAAEAQRFGRLLAYGPTQTDTLSHESFSIKNDLVFPILLL